MSRNSERLGGTQDMNAGANPPVTQDNNNSGNAFSFVIPTNFVELPSKGKYYPEGHPLHNEETIEIRHMTAKEEDILTSKALLKKGVALDRVIQNLIVDKGINADHLLTGDRNAIVIAARVAAYGADYETKVTCPACGVNQEYSFNLVDAETHEGHAAEALEVVDNNDGTFEVELPMTKVNVTFKLLTGVDEKRIINIATDRKNRAKNKGVENNVTTQLSSILVAVNGDRSIQAMRYLIDNMPSMDSRHLRFAHRTATPNVELAETFTCSDCDFTQEMEVPLTADFFWPKR